MSVKLFVGGLAWSTTDDGLRDAFSKYGEVIIQRLSPFFFFLSFFFIFSFLSFFSPSFSLHKLIICSCTEGIERKSL
jgi:RNA recognition motif-containing protein